MTNPFKRTALPDAHYCGTKRRALMGSLSSTAKGKAFALSQENLSAPFNFTVQELQFLCHMCFDPKPRGESFPINGCSHSYCNDCTANHIGTKLQKNVLRIRCPAGNCSGLLEPRNCRSILPEEVVDRWDIAMSEALILEDFSVMLIADGEDTISESEPKSKYFGS